jgi:hypothetical protein
MLANYRMAALNKEVNNAKAQHELLLANTLSDCVLGNPPANIDTAEGFELQRAYEISSRPITLVIGNPPSSDSSKINLGENFDRISELMEDFRPPQKGRHGRQNTQKQTNNPHSQFLRWVCYKLENSQNHSVLACIVSSRRLKAKVA